MISGFSRKYLLATLIAIALLAISMPLAWNYYDVQFFIDWVNVIDEHGLLSVYKYAYRAAYPPLAIATFYYFYKAGERLSMKLLDSINIDLVRVVVKIPLVISLLLLFIVMYKEFGKEALYYSMLSYFIYSNVFAYQFDIMVALGVLLSYYFYKRGSFIQSGASLALSTLYKHLIVLVAPYLGLVILKRHGWRSFAFFAAGLLIPIAITILPFFMQDPWAFYNQVISFHGTRYPQFYSVWAIPLHIVRDDVCRLPRALTTMWMTPFILIYLAALATLIMLEEQGYVDVFKGMGVIVITLLLLNKVGNPTYLVWSIPFTALTISKVRNKWAKAYYVLFHIFITFAAGYPELYSAAVLGEKYFYIENVNPLDLLACPLNFSKCNLCWLDARGLLIKSFNGPGGEELLSFLLTFSGKYMLFIHEILYGNIYIFRLATTLVYVLTLAAFMLHIYGTGQRSFGKRWRRYVDRITSYTLSS